ncbi:hypothetical protein AGMMS49983_01160 [Clostridia bacterium]|nr:hypothetical protein AGMMS49983_01160 [Clostridia bacterium]
MKKKRKWPFVLAGVVVVLFVLLWALGDEEVEPAGYDFAETTPFQTSAILDDQGDFDGTWAVYWYLCGSDLESDGGFASGDLEEMTQVRLPDNISVVIETGGARQWHNGAVADSNSRYLYDSEGLALVDQLPSANMGDSRTLENFLQFCGTNYPADRQIVIFWDHGGGSVAGVAFDERYDYDALTLPEIRTAFESVVTPSKQTPPYEMIGFDACLMATIDVADSLNGLARYMVASQESEPALGWEYTGIFQALADAPGMSAARFGQVICDTYYAACANEDLADEITLSVVDLGRVDTLMSAYYDIGAESLIYACVEPSYFSEYGRAARSAVSYGGNNSWDGYTNMVDLGDIVRQAGDSLLPEYGRALLSALDDCVVYQVRGPLRNRSSGLSKYYNFDGDYDNLRGYMALRDDDPFQWFYDFQLTGSLSGDGERYVRNLAERYSQPQEITQTSVPDSEGDGLEDFPLTYTDDGYAVLELGPETADKLTGVYCYVAYYDEEEEIIILLGRDNDLDADWESGVFMDNFRGVWGSIDGCLVYMELTDEADEYQLYTVPVLLNGEEYSLSVSYTYDDEEYRILGARRGIDENGMVDKNLRQLLPGDVVEPLHYVMFDMEDEDEEFTVMAVESLTVTGSTRFEEADLGDGLYIIMFEMVDVRNNSYLSETAAFSVEGGEIYLLDE